MCIAVAMLVILGYEQLLVLLVEVVDKLLRAEEVAQVALLVGFLHRPLQLLLVEGAVAGDVYLIDLDLLLLVDVDVKDEAVLLGHIVALQDVDLRVLEALVVEVPLDDNLRTVYHVGGNLVSLTEVQFGLQVLLLRLLHAVIVHLRQAWTLREGDVQIGLVAHRLLDGDAHVGEEPVLPVAFHRIGYLVAGHGDYLSYREARKSYQHIVFVAVDTGDRDIGNLVALGGRVEHRRIADGVGECSLCQELSARQREESHQGDIFNKVYALFHSFYLLSFSPAICSLVLPNLLSLCW